VDVPAGTGPWRTGGALLLRVDLDGELTEAARARRLAAAALLAVEPAPALRPWAVGTVVGELVANAIVHTGMTSILRLRLLADPEALLVEVYDPCPARPRLVSAGQPDALRDAGRGLALVDRLAIRWGWTPTGSGKTVWAELRS
jgi:anti-sigma regulatory factor (Ser/Thr protein kinase)